MVKDISVTNSKTLSEEHSDMDGMIKLIIAVLLMVIPFYIQAVLSFGLFAAYLVFVTLMLKVNPRTLMISGASFAIIVLIPYLFGLLMNALFYYFLHNPLFAYQGSMAIFLRLFRLFVIWYVSILYFHTTPMKTFIGMLDKFLTPLKKLGLPTSDYLKVIMCIVVQLKETGSDVKKNLGEKMRSAVGEEKRKFRINVKGISQIIVNLIVDSFEKIDKIQEYVEKVSPEDLYYYRFGLRLKDAAGMLTFLVIVALIWGIETGII